MEDRWWRICTVASALWPLSIPHAHSWPLIIRVLFVHGVHDADIDTGGVGTQNFSILYIRTRYMRTRCMCTRYMCTWQWCFGSRLPLQVLGRRFTRPQAKQLLCNSGTKFVVLFKTGVICFFISRLWILDYFYNHEVFLADTQLRVQPTPHASLASLLYLSFISARHFS